MSIIRPFVSRMASVVASIAIALTSVVGLAAPASAANTSELVITYADLQFILKQIQISEAHASVEQRANGVPVLGQVVPASSVLGTGPNDVPFAGLPWGLRTVDGSLNNLIMGNNGAGKPYSKLGAADQLFPRMVPAQFGSTPLGQSYAPTVTPATITDTSIRTISNLIADQSANNPAAVAVSGGVIDPDTANPPAGFVGGSSQQILNTSPAGLAPTNSMFVFFGQFFDHGLDLVGKLATKFVVMPIPQDGTDPLRGTGSIMLNRTDYSAAERAQGANVTTAATNKTTPWIDQNQTYASVASKQVFLRDYTAVNNVPVATGHLLTGPGGAIANWALVKQQARTILGIDLTDESIESVPLILTNEHGRFLPGPNGLPQVVFPPATVGGPNVIVEGNLQTPISVVGAVSTKHAFLDDIAHNAAPFGRTGPLAPDADLIANPTTAVLPAGTYDNELLDAHYVTGDGRGNENIGLTAIHTVFHAEHNRLADQIKAMVDGLGNADAVKTGFTDAAGWGYGERLFQAARFVNEMEYQHLVFDTFVRRFEPTIRPFVAYDPTLNPDITAEFASAVYRFGHSQLNEGIRRTNTNGTTNNTTLFEGFLNPLAFTNGYVDTPQYGAAMEAAASVARGSVSQVSNEIDEFVTGTLRNNLVGIPLDLASLNIARGRDIGLPTLNAFRRAVFAQTQLAAMTPYASWNDFARNLRNASSLQNFIAAYGNHTAQRAQFGNVVINETLRDSGQWLLTAGNTAGSLQLRFGAVNRVTVNVTIGGAATAAQTVGITSAAGACRVTQNNVVNNNTTVNLTVGLGSQLTITPDAGLAATPGCGVSDRLTWTNANGSTLTRSLTTAAMRADAATAMLDANFMNGVGQWTPAASGLDDIDLWMGGLAETRGTLGGLLGSTFTYVFKQQMENLQEGDRFYYIGRLAGTNLLLQVQNNTLADLFIRNTSAKNLPANFFDAVQLEVAITGGTATTPTWTTNPTPLTALQGTVDRLTSCSAFTGGNANFVTYTGALAAVFIGRDTGAAVINDCLRGGSADDTLRGFAGNDVLDGFLGNDSLHGGIGDDVLIDTGLAGSVDIALGGGGNDYLATGSGGDINDGGAGNDYFFLGPDGVTADGGPGNDVLEGGMGVDAMSGDDDDDWLDGGSGGDLLTGDALLPPLGVDVLAPGRDVLIGGLGNDSFDGGGAMDIFGAGDSSPILSTGSPDTAIGGAGFDWVTYSTGYFDPTAPVGAIGPKGGVVTDLTLAARNPADVSQLGMDLFIDGDVEGLSGGNGNDSLYGDERSVLVSPLGISDRLLDSDVGLIAGLNGLVTGPAADVSGNIILGGGGSDTIMGRGGNDIIDGDLYLGVKLQEQCPNAGTWVDATIAQIRDLIRVGTVNGTCNASMVRIVRSLINGNANGDVDTAMFRGARADYIVTLLSAGVYEVAGPDGTDVVRNIEWLLFDDGNPATPEEKLTPAQAVGNQLPTLIAPTGLQGTATGTQVALSWTRPTGAGIAPVTGYIVEVWTGTQWTRPSQSLNTPGGTTFTLTGLASGTAYRFRVMAVYTVNANPVDGPASAELVLTTDAVLGGISYPAPGTVSGSTTTSSATVNWVAPANPPAAVSSYKIWMSTDNVQWTAVPAVDGQTTTTTVTGLNPATPYLFTVNAVYGTAPSAVEGPQAAAVLLTTQAVVAPPIGGGGGGGFFPPVGPGVTTTEPTVVKAASGATSSFTALTAPMSFQVPLPNGSNAQVMLPVGAVTGAGNVTITASQPQAGLVTLDIRVTTGGNSVTEFTVPLEVNLGKVHGDAAVVTSVNGVDWTKLPLLAGTTLPAGQKDGYYIAANGDVIVLTRHLTYFGAKLPQATLTVDSAQTAKVGDKWSVKVAGGSGTGGTTFSTSTSGVCSVAADGVVVALAEGVCSITAKRAGDPTYLGSQSSALEIKVTAAASAGTGSTKPTVKATSAGNRRTLTIAVGSAYAGMRAEVQIRKAGTVGFRTTARVVLGTDGNGRTTVTAASGSIIRILVAGKTLTSVRVG